MVKKKTKKQCNAKNPPPHLHLTLFKPKSLGHFLCFSFANVIKLPWPQKNVKTIDLLLPVLYVFFCFFFLFFLFFLLFCIGIFYPSF